MQVRDVMTGDVVTASPAMPLPEAAEVLVQRRLRAVPVIDDEGHVLGMITDRQLMTHFLPTLENLDGERPAIGSLVGDGEVRDVMERAVMCVNEDEPLADVIRLMLDKEIERLPVVREGLLVGFLTRGDIIRRLLGRAESEGGTPSTDPTERQDRDAE